MFKFFFWSYSFTHLIHYCFVVFILLSGFEDTILKLTTVDATTTTTTTLINGENYVKLCGPDMELIELKKNGKKSSINIDLSKIEMKNVCKLRVIAPKTHVVHVQFIPNTEESSLILNKNNNKSEEQEEYRPCVMSIFLPENPRTPVWKGDPCSLNSLTEVDLLTPDFKILWLPPSNPNNTRGRKLILTAVGQGAVCKEPNQHTCMKIGWDPMLCISDHLLCDGIKHCPPSPSASDEDENFCQRDFITHNTLRQLAIEIFKKKWPNTNKLFQQSTNNNNNNEDDLLNTIESKWKEMKKSENSTTTTKPETKQNDSLSQVLSKYGPWGYLMLGMLICGTVLLFCGLWECCIKKPKTPIESSPHCTQPTTVLIINQQQQQSEDTQPPNYDDLDQPPSYVTLFPNTNSLKQSENNNDNNNDSSSNESATSTSDNSTENT